MEPMRVSEAAALPAPARPRPSSPPPAPPWPPRRSGPLLEHTQSHHHLESQQHHGRRPATLPGSGATLSSSTSAPWNGSVTKSDLRDTNSCSGPVTAQNRGGGTEHPPDLPQRVHLDPVVASVVHVSDLHLVGVLVEGDDLSSPPGSFARRSGTYDANCTHATTKTRVRGGLPPLGA